MVNKINICKKLNKLDAEIRTMEKPTKDFNKYLVEVGLFESLGEMGGDILTLTFEQEPNEEDIIRDTKEHLFETLEKYQNSMLSFREEEQLNILNKIFK